MQQQSSSKRAGVWIRVSTEDQVRDESPEHHEKRSRLYAEAKGLEVIEVYRLDAISGKTLKDQPKCKRMLADIRRGHITCLIFSKLARLARNTKELLEFSEIFRECDADLISLAKSIDTSSKAIVPGAAQCSPIGRSNASCKTQPPRVPGGRNFRLKRSATLSKR